MCFVFAANSVVELQRRVSKAWQVSIGDNGNTVWNAAACKSQPPVIWDIPWSIC